MTKHHRKRGAIGLGMAVVALALAGCTLPGNVPLGSSPIINGGTTIENADRAASIKGTRLCVINSSTSSMSIFWRGYPNAREIPVGGRNCNSGYETTRDVPDVKATISYAVADEVAKVRTLEVSANNFWQFPPGAASIIIDSTGAQRGVCHDFAIGQSKFVDTGWLHGEMIRVDDSDDNKEFEFTLTDKVGEPGGGDCGPVSS